MADLDTYVDRIKRKGDFRAEAIMIQNMVSEVNSFVSDIAAADLLISQMHSIQRDLDHNKKLTDEEREDLETKIKDAKEAKSMINKYREAIKSLKGPISQLNSTISKLH